MKKIKLDAQLIQPGGFYGTTLVAPSVICDIEAYQIIEEEETNEEKTECEDI